MIFLNMPNESQTLQSRKSHLSWLPFLFPGMQGFMLSSLYLLKTWSVRTTQVNTPGKNVVFNPGLPEGGFLQGRPWTQGTLSRCSGVWLSVAMHWQGSSWHDFPQILISELGGCPGMGFDQEGS